MNRLYQGIGGCGGGFFLLLFLACFPAESVPTHGIALHGGVKYPSTFKHFDYVNPHAPKGGTLTQHALGTFDSLNPFIMKGTAAAGLQFLFPGPLYASLTQKSADEPFSEYGYLAETMDLAEDRCSITYFLRKEATFQDGSPVRPEDVIFSFKTAREKGNPLYKAYYGDVVKIEKVGERGVKFSFRDGKNRELPLIIGQMPIFSEAFYKGKDFETPSLEVPLASGPYKIVEVDPGHSITYEKIEKWWGENLPVNGGRYNFKRLKFIYFRDTEVSFQGFSSGDYDYRAELSAKNWAKRYDFPAFKKGDVKREEIEHSLYNGMTMLSFNTRREKFKDWRVRKAISILFDFEWTNKHVLYGTYKKRPLSFFAGKGLGAEGLPTEAELNILKPYTAELPPEILTQAFNLPSTTGDGRIRPLIKESLALLKEAGYILKEGHIRQSKTGASLDFEILFVDPSSEKLLQGFVKNLSEVGIKVTLKPLDSSQYVVRIHNFDFDMVGDASLQSDSPGNEQRELWGSKAADQKGSRNLIGVKNKVVDEIIERLIDAPTREDLLAHIRALDRVLMWGYYVVPLVHHDYVRFAYWKKLNRPRNLPAYEMDMMTWWSEETPTVPSSSDHASAQNTEKEKASAQGSKESKGAWSSSAMGKGFLFLALLGLLGLYGRRRYAQKQKEREISSPSSEKEERER